MVAKLDNTATKNAQATLGRWIGESPDGACFLPGNGKAIPLGPDEKLAICASAEAHIVRRYEGFQRSIFVSLAALTASWLYIFRFKTTVFLGTFWTVYAYLLLVVTLFYLLFEAWHYERALMTLRKAIGHALRDRIPLSTGFDDRAAYAEPDLERLGPILIFGTGLAFAFPILVQIAGAILR